MTFVVYILYSVKLDKFYIGTTNDVERRITEHNDSKYTKSYTVKGIPWKLYLTIKCHSSEHAYLIEKYIKARKSSEYIKKLSSDGRLISDLIKKFK